MSGIEVAGLVLGAIPIVTAALKELNNSTDKIQRFRKWKCELPSFVRRLNSQRICLKRSLDLLFRLSGLPPPDLNDLDKDSKESLWKDTTISASIRAKHEDIYDAVESDFVVILDHMKALCDKLGFGNFVQVRELKETWAHCLSTSGSRLKFRDRVTYSVSGDTIRQLLSQIDDRQQSIRGILSDIHMLAQYPKVERQRSHTPGLMSARKDATLVYDALHQVLACTEHTHSVKLELDHDLGDEFIVIPVVGSPSERAYRVGISTPEVDCFVFTEVEVVSDSSKANFSPINGTQPASIAKFCRDCHLTIAPMGWIGLFIDETRGPVLHGVHQPANCAQRLAANSVVPHRFITLRHALQSSAMGQIPSFTRPSERNRKLLLSRISAYALLLESTPWRSELWHMEDIEFLLTTNETTQATVDFQRPFVNRVPNLRPRQAGSGQASAMRPCNSSRQFLLHLCLLIMEIHLCERIEDRRQGSYSLVTNETYELELLTTLIKWKETRWDEFSAAVQGVITQCLCSVLRPAFSLNLEQDLENAIQNVVLPIKAE